MGERRRRYGLQAFNGAEKQWTEIQDGREVYEQRIMNRHRPGELSRIGPNLHDADGFKETKPVKKARKLNESPIEAD